MRCDEVAEYVSAICDGETIPHDAAAHLRECAVCSGLIQEYIVLGVALRREASLEFSAPSTPHWETKTGVIYRLWRKGWGTMRIPRVAFAAIVLMALIAVGAGWKMIRVGAQGTGSVVLLTIEREGQSEPAICPLSVVDPHDGGCAFGGEIDPMKNTAPAVSFKVAGRTADGVRLLVKTTIHTAANPNVREEDRHEPNPSMDKADLVRQSSREMLLVPGVPLKIQVEGMGTMTLRAEWSDHMPPWRGMLTNIDPGPTELRISNPFLLKEDTRIGDITASAGTENGFEHGVAIVYPEAGRYLFSLAPIKDAVVGDIKENRIDFEYNGANFVLLTGAPISRQKKVWIRAQPNYKNAHCRGCYGVSTRDIRKLAIEK